VAKTQTELALIARQLLTGWEAWMTDPLVVTQRGRKHPMQAAVTHGLCAHVHYLAPSALDLLDSGRVLAALPLVRAGFEAAIDAQWVAQTKDGWAAFLNEDLRQRQNLVKSLEQAASHVFREAAPSVARYSHLEKLETTASVRHFQHVCDDLVPAGGDAYITYRSMSHLTHASGLVVDLYLESDDGPAGLARRMTPKEPSALSWTFIVAASLVWAGRAVDFLDKKRLRRSELRSAARAIGTTSELKLSDAARAREA
jgi:hypothetical protein